MVLPYIKMNLPQVYMCSPSWTLLPPPSPYHPSGLSQCTSPKHPVSCIEPGLATRFIYDIIHISMPFSQIFPPSPSPSPTESKRLFCEDVFPQLWTTTTATVRGDLILSWHCLFFYWISHQLFHFIFVTTLTGVYGRYYFPHVRDENVQGCEITYPRSLTYLVKILSICSPVLFP